MTKRSFKRGNETSQTYELKWAAWEWLYSVAQCRCVGLEVRLEGPAGRVVDLVGIGPGNTIYIVEVKASRSDFARDNHTAQDRAKLEAQGSVLQQKLLLAERILEQAAEHAKAVSPENWEQVRTYRVALADRDRLVREQTNYRNRLASFSTKLHDPRFLNIADYHYLLVPRGLIPRRAVPPQWGLLDETSQVVVPAPAKDIRKNTGIISNILRSIARSNTTSMMRYQGVIFAEDGAVFPRD